jgi:short-subunit dehydrogenase
MIQFEGSTAVITGAANGLGRALAAELARRGYNLALIDRDEVGLESLRRDLKNDRSLVTIHVLDISDEAAIVFAKDNIVEKHGRIDLLINNAGVSVSKKFSETTQGDWEWLFATNFWGSIYCCRHFCPELLKSPGGKLGNVISGFALMGFPGKSAYAASKGALMSFTQVLKSELQETSVSVSLVIPPPLNTRIVAKGRHSTMEKQQLESAFLQKHGMPLEKAAKKIVDGILRGQFRIVIGRREKMLDFFLRLMPATSHRFLARIQDRFDFS